MEQEEHALGVLRRRQLVAVVSIGHKYAYIWSGSQMLSFREFIFHKRVN